jgi:hypothetical protein
MGHADKCGHCHEVEQQRIAAAKRDLAEKVLDAIGKFRGSDVRKVDVVTVLRRVFIDSGIELTTTQQQEGE